MFKLPQEVKEDSKKYGVSLKEFLDGKVNDARFKGVRVPWGIYSHRGGKIFMTRIRVPAGQINAGSLKALAGVCAKYSDKVAHITTRQDIQLHNVKIEDTIKVIDELSKDDLSPRGGGGNTIRNILACPYAGICPDEVFDVGAHSVALTEYLLRQDTSFTLPRKLKFSFSGCRKDCAGVLVNDLGFLAEIKDSKFGFRVFVGGGMGAHPKIGKLLEEFIPEQDLGYIAQAVKNVFYKNGDRRNKHRNRLRFLIEDIGMNKLVELYKQELAQLKENEHIVLRKITDVNKDEAKGGIPQNEDSDYKQFVKYNLFSQKQEGYSVVSLRIPRGNITSDELLALADLGNDFSQIEFRTNSNQGISICWVKNSDVYNLFLKLKDKFKNFLYSNSLLNVVACKGALTCNLGLCNSPALAEAIEEMIEKDFIDKKLFKKLEIKLNGCPNACGHHPIGKIALHGMVKRVDNRPVPFYKLLLGGRKEVEKTHLAEEVGLIPARNVVKFLSEFLKKAEENIDEGSDIYEFITQKAKTIAKEILENYSYVPAYSENRDFYIDWGRDSDFSLAGLGTGECGAGVLDMIEADLSLAKIALAQAESKDYGLDNLKIALFNSARSLLVVKGAEPKSDVEALKDFKEKFINASIASDEYRDIDEIYQGLNDKLSLDERREKFAYIKKFFEHVSQIYKDMDSTFNFPKRAASDTIQAQDAPSKILDLKGTPCPINYVKAKLVLEDLNSGDILEVLLDEGAPIENVPRSLRDDGHEVLSMDKQGEFYKVRVKKK